MMPIIAVITLPIITPSISTVIISFNRLIIDKRIKKINNEPKMEDIIMPELLDIEMLDVEIPKKLMPIIKIATPKPAPELIPSIYGPASGFLKSVCICNPLTDKAAPQSSAAIALGSLDSRIIILQLSFSDVFPRIIFIILLKGIFTDPKNKSKLKKSTEPINKNSTK
jgi:hypothetical protein